MKITYSDASRPWWMEWPIEKQMYRDPKLRVTKADKVKAAMAVIYAVKESMRPQRKADRGIAIVRGAIK